uniref:Uncharacterized protein n=1 Tax=Rhodosorus marinus TaxID=101924 RepID=A0A7S3E8F8_9RHOD
MRKKSPKVFSVKGYESSLHHPIFVLLASARAVELGAMQRVITRRGMSHRVPFLLDVFYGRLRPKIVRTSLVAMNFQAGDHNFEKPIGALTTAGPRPASMLFNFPVRAEHQIHPWLG